MAICWRRCFNHGLHCLLSDVFNGIIFLVLSVPYNLHHFDNISIKLDNSSFRKAKIDSLMSRCYQREESMTWGYAKPSLCGKMITYSRMFFQTSLILFHMVDPLVGKFCLRNIHHGLALYRPTILVYHDMNKWSKAIIHLSSLLCVLHSWLSKIP